MVENYLKKIENKAVENVEQPNLKENLENRLF